MLTTFSAYVSNSPVSTGRCILTVVPKDLDHEGNIEWYSRLPFISRTLPSNTFAASKVFSAMSGRVLHHWNSVATNSVTVFDMLRMDIQATFFIIPQLIQGVFALYLFGPLNHDPRHRLQRRSPSSVSTTSCSMYVSSEHDFLQSLAHFVSLRRSSSTSLPSPSPKPQRSCPLPSLKNIKTPLVSATLRSPGPTTLPSSQSPQAAREGECSCFASTRTSSSSAESST